MAEDNAAQGAAPANRATMRYGVYSQSGNFAGKTVKEVRDTLSAQWGIPADAVAYQGKNKLDDNAVVENGSNIEFHVGGLGE